MGEYRHLPPESLQLPQVDKQICLALDGKIQEFSTANSAYWVYPERYAAFNHLNREGEDGNYKIWFGLNSEDYDALHEAGITQIFPPYPTDEVIRMFWAIEMADFDHDLMLYHRAGHFPNGDDNENNQ